MLSILLTILASSLDGFAVGIVMGMKRIHISWGNLILMSLFPFLIAMIGMHIAHQLLDYMDESTSKFLGIALYFALAIYSFVTTHINQHNVTWMDPNNDQQITGMEIVSVGLALSMDTLIVALPLSFFGHSILLCATLFALCNAGMIGLGNTIAKRLPKTIGERVGQMSWILFLYLGLRHLF